jgi:hypothetical protein
MFEHSRRGERNSFILGAEGPDDAVLRNKPGIVCSAARRRCALTLLKASSIGLRFHLERPADLLDPTDDATQDQQGPPRRLDRFTLKSTEQMGIGDVPPARNNANSLVRVVA